MYEPHDPHLKVVASKLSPEAWAARVEAARKRQGGFERVHEGIERGLSARAAIREVFPGEPIESRYEQYLRYRDQGFEGLIDHQLLVTEPKVTPEMAGFIHGLLGADSSLRSVEICARVEKRFRIRVGGSTMRVFLEREGLAAPRGRPKGSGERSDVEALPCAGAELLKAVEIEVGAVDALTREIGGALEALSPPVGEVRDDRENRDESGRFLAAYNEPRPRGDPELGERFEAVERKREGKDLTAMRAARSAQKTLYRKNLAMTLLPLLAPSMRWDGLSGWKGDWLEGLCGYGYQPATLDKYVRELKYAGVAEAAREGVARFWIGAEETQAEAVTGAVVLYADISTKPHWTHHFSRSVKVSRLGGRVMPGASTVVLNSGYGTPLVYRTLYGHASLPREVPDLLRRYEEAAGEGTARRIVVMDREAHAAWLFKALDPDWLFVVPLRGRVMGEGGTVDEQTPWESYRGDDACCSGALWLNDTKDPGSPVRVRVVGRRRARTGKEAFFATNAPESDFSASTLLDFYFDRWPLQEHVFRNANAAVNLAALHGYGKKKVQNVAVLDRVEKLGGQIHRIEKEVESAESGREAVLARLDLVRTRISGLERHIPKLRGTVGRAMDAHVSPGQPARESFRALAVCEDWLASSRQEAARLEKTSETEQARTNRLRETALAKTAEREALLRRTEVFTVDTELDEILTAFKLTFLNLCARLLKDCFPAIRMETSTLVDHVLTLPGQRVRTRGTETIRIWRQPRERRFMDAVEEACRILTARNLVRDGRTLRFEVADAPAS